MGSQSYQGYTNSYDHYSPVRGVVAEALPESALRRPRKRQQENPGREE
jgi:hypothetical protein